MINQNTIRLFVLIISLSLPIGCGDRNGRMGKLTSDAEEISEMTDTTYEISEIKEVDKLIFFLENSGSMFGYVTDPGNFQNAIVRLAYLPEFDNSDKRFYFINGTSQPVKNSGIFVNYIGDDPDILRSNLNRDSFRKYGDTRLSDLTRIFEIALDSTSLNEVAIIVSDCIYDVGEESDPITALQIETLRTNRLFRERLVNENIQTILIKAYSQFNGRYFFASQPQYKVINQQRPYYFLIFGESELLSKIFTEENIIKTIAGYEAMARFLKIENFDVQYQATTQNKKGSFRFDRRDKNKLTNSRRDRHSQDFQFSIAVNLASLPFSEEYLMSKDNFHVTKGNYSITGISKPGDPIFGLSFTPTHLITVNSDTNPYGNLEIALKNNIPEWIDGTNADEETSIEEDTTKTFGFKYLTDAITEAYQHVNQQKNITVIKIEIIN